MGAMEVETKFLRLFKPVALGDRIDGWRVVPPFVLSAP
jgi:hypothetical protein